MGRVDVNEGDAVSPTVLPVLWLRGPPCAGKSTTAWALYQQLVAEGAAVAYVDIDQLGMCFPPQAGDPDRHQVKARNVGAVVRNFGRSGARVVIVSGVTDPDEIPRYVEQCHGSALTFISLTASQEQLLVRNRARGRGEDMVAAVLRDAQALEASTFAAAIVATDGLAVEQVARRVLERVPDWVAAARAAPGEDHAASEDGRVSDAHGPVLWLHGAPAVGKSTIGWQLFMEALGKGTAAFVDLAQLGFLSPTPVDDPGVHRLKAANLAALWDTYRAAGARSLVVTGGLSSTGDLARYRTALPHVELRLCRLRVEAGHLAHRVAERGRGGGPDLPGDTLAGATPEHLEQAVTASAAMERALAAAGIDGWCVDTSGMSVAAAAARVRRVVGEAPALLSR
jgi:adenylylsulfate kinase-like enzyme